MQHIVQYLQSVVQSNYVWSTGWSENRGHYVWLRRKTMLNFIYCNIVLSGSGVLKTWTVENGGLDFFWLTLCTLPPVTKKHTCKITKLNISYRGLLHQKHNNHITSAPAALSENSTICKTQLYLAVQKLAARQDWDEVAPDAAAVASPRLMSGQAVSTPIHFPSPNPFPSPPFPYLLYSPFP